MHLVAPPCAVVYSALHCRLRRLRRLRRFHCALAPGADDVSFLEPKTLQSHTSPGHVSFPLIPPFRHSGLLVCCCCSGRKKTAIVTTPPDLFCTKLSTLVLLIATV